MKGDFMNKNDNLNTSGWDAITLECERVYPEQKDPIHYGTLIDWKFGGKDPLEGISVYDGGDYWHFVTYGLTELYDKESKDKDVSGYGYEMTFKLKKGVSDDNEIKCICGILQEIARITFDEGEVFKPNEYLYTGQSVGIDSRGESNIVGFITAVDSSFNSIDTSNGKVNFTTFIGVTNDELSAIMKKEITVLDLYNMLGSDVTDYNRKSVI